jgi:hypothetical protein
MGIGHKYTDEERAFISEFFCAGHTYNETISAYNEKFDDHMTFNRLKGYISNHKLVNGRTGRFKKGNVPHNKGKHTPSVGRMVETQFKAGHMPHNTKPIGYERISKDGFIEVKVREKPENGRRNFEFKHRWIWEQAHGEIPKGYIITFLDGNPKKCELENLAMISKAENLQLQRAGLRKENPKLTETGILISRAYVITKKKSKKEHHNVRT